ncbi:MAG: leucine-rich repeat protein [Oscillospiraceae bacterium]|nr:leucine-rich repeat protein [Oscillospiraceae bacterium]
MAKRVFSLLLVLVMVVGMLPATATAAELDNGLVYQVYADHVEITDYTGDAAEVVIPAGIEGLPVTAIGRKAFEMCSTLESISIPDSVISIGTDAFCECYKLTGISIPDGVTSLDNAFFNCTKLTSIDLPESLTSIGEYTFACCENLTSISLPEGVASIGNAAFEGCSSLASILFAGDAPQISADAFNGVYATAYFPAGNPTWTEDVMQNYGIGSITWVAHTHEYTAFVTAPTCTEEGCTTYTCSCGDSYVDDYVDALGHNYADGVCTRCGEFDNGLVYQVYTDHVEITDYTGDAAELVIPAEIEGLPVTVIEYSAFDSCHSLTSIVLPDSITYIGSFAFCHCENLTNIDLPDDVTFIGNWVFTGCESLTSIVLPDGITSTGESAFSECSSLTSIVLPDSLTSIGDTAFSWCTSLVSIVLPDGVTSIGELAFSGCSSLTSIVLPDSLTSIGDRAFQYCSSLASIDLPDSITSIGDYAFRSCSSLTSIVFPDGVTSIGDHAFYFCSSLTSILFAGDAPQISADAFHNVYATACYPADNPTWTEDVMQDYGGNITWIPYTPNPFTDVPAGSFYEAPVLWALENGITTGVSPTSFAPEDQCLRSQVVTFLHRAAKNPAPTSTKNPFTDVKTGDFFYNPVLWAVEKGITTGVSADRFGSYDVCNRAAVVTFLWRAAGSPEPASTNNPFTDVKTGDFFYKPVLWAVENGITNGLSATEFGPTANCNRAQVVTFLYRAYN